MNLFYFISLLALIFSVTNFIYLSVLPILFLPLSFTLIVDKNFILPKYIVFFLLLVFYILISILFYDKSSLFNFDFYRRDGNFFITYLIFFSIVMLGYTRDPRKDLFLCFSIISFVSFFGFIFGHNEGNLVHFFLFESHNAAGGFYGVISAICLGFYLENKSKKYLFLSLIFTFFLLMTDSRGTVIALFLTFLYYFFIRFRFPLTVFVCFITSQVFLVIFTYSIWIREGKFISDESTFDGSITLSGIQRGGTIIDRTLYLWPRAIDNFLHSPLFGIGFGSYDDLGYSYNTILPFISEKINQTIRHTDAHAHNSYFTILAELGVVGFILFFIFFYYIYKEICKIEFWAKDLSLALKFAFWVCIFSSATEHRLTTPSQMIPFLIILALALAYNRHLNLRSRVY